MPSATQKIPRFLIFILFCLPLLAGCDSRRTIVNGLDEKEANGIIVFLSDHNIDAYKVKSEEGGGVGAQSVVLWDISVPEEEATKAMSILNNAGLPRRRGSSLLDIFSKGGLVPTELQEKIKYQAGLAEQIASAIRKIDGVLDAEVVISFPEEDPLNPGAPKEPITASIFVKHSGVLEDPNSHLISRIKQYVTSAVTGLRFENVNLTPVRARYSDLPVGGYAATEEEKDYVSVWTLILAQESVTRFRFIFFSFTLLILFGTLALVWILWKTYPLLREAGGFKELFHIHPLKKRAAGKPPEEEEEPAEEEEKKKEEKKKKPKEEETAFEEPELDEEEEFEEEFEEPEEKE